MPISRLGCKEITAWSVYSYSWGQAFPCSLLLSGHLCFVLLRQDLPVATPGLNSLCRPGCRSALLILKALILQASFLTFLILCFVNWFLVPSFLCPSELANSRQWDESTGTDCCWSSPHFPGKLLLEILEETWIPCYLSKVHILKMVQSWLWSA